MTDDVEGVTQPWRPPEKKPIAVWLGSAQPIRSIRWLDGTLALAAKFGAATAIAAGDATWLDLAADRATRATLQSVGVMTDLQLDYLGWAQIAAAVIRQLGASTIFVDEASRPERFPEVAAIAELLDAAQLTHVVSLVPDGKVIHAARVAGRELQSVRIRGSAVIGVRVAGPMIEEYPTPIPSAAMKRYDLAGLGLDPVVLAHRALTPRAVQEPRRTIEQVADLLSVHVVPPAPPGGPAGKPALGRARTATPDAKPGRER
jgi:electron transfer flavoprotein alpha/beta subunit